MTLSIDLGINFYGSITCQWLLRSGGTSYFEDLLYVKKMYIYMNYYQNDKNNILVILLTRDKYIQRL